MWRVVWVLPDAVRTGVRRRVLAGWDDLALRENRAGIKPGDPILLSPDYRVDPLLSSYVQSAAFRRYTAETRRNYVTDIALLLTFLWARGKSWTDAAERDLEDYEHWRRFAAENPARVGGSKWDRELAAFTSLYGWAVENKHMTVNPVAMRQVRGLHGAIVTVPAARAKDSRPSNVHWLTPRTWRRWIDVGLRGHGRAGAPDPGWAGRLEDRNVAFARLLVSSGLRRAEGGSLLTFEVPELQLDGGRYYRGKVAAAVTRSKNDRTFYVAADAVGEIEAYAESSRAWAVSQAQRKGLYERLPGARVVTEITRRVKPVVRWRGLDGTSGETALSELTVQDRMLLLTEGTRGLEPLWLWLNERGMPFGVHSWNGVGRHRAADLDVHAPVGPFCFGIQSDSGKEWAKAEGLDGSPFKRGRRTVIALDRREPGQHSRETHDRHYVLPDKRVQARAVEVIAAGAEDAADRAQKAVLAAELRDRPASGDVETATADCSSYHDSPYPSLDGSCCASFLICLACPCARVHPGHHPRLAHLHEALGSLRSVLPPATWAADWRDSYDRLEDLRRRLGDGVWAQALARVTDTDREVVNHLLTGALSA